MKLSLAVLSLVLLAGTAAVAQQRSAKADSLLRHGLAIVDLPEWRGTHDTLRPRLGIYTTPLTEADAAGIAGFPSGARGFRVWHLMPHWPADEGGMMIGDVIVAMNGAPIGDSAYAGDEFMSVAARKLRPGENVSFTIVRNGVARELRFPLFTARWEPVPFVRPARLPETSGRSWLMDAIERQGLVDWSATIQKQMQAIADQDFCTVRFADRPSPWRLNAVTYLHHYPTRTGAVSRLIVDDLWNGTDAAPGLHGAVSAAARELGMPRVPGRVKRIPETVGALRNYLDEIAMLLDSAYAPVRGDLPAMIAELRSHLALEKNWEERLDSIADPVRKRETRLAEERRLASLFGRALRVRTGELAEAAMMLATLADSAWPARFAVAARDGAARAGKVEGVEGTVLAVWATRHGAIVIGGPGHNRYSGDLRFVIDVGGDDDYALDPVPAGRFRYVADLAGNDGYQSAGSGQGAGLGAVEVTVDVAGNDTYRAEGWAQGAGILGVGVLADLGGDDLYTAHWCAQGSAFAGIGILYDGRGSDQYSADIYAQGFGYVAGYGALLDREGNDSYRAGWKHTDSRVPGRAHLSMSQGFGFGMRPWSVGVGTDGGIGVLSDLAGHDLYAADFFSQGGSYWYALGVLHDAEGCDRYTAGQYSQGSGIHLSFGALLDDAGDDMYDAYAGLEQGNAHDWSAGCLEDWSGNDTYRGSTSSQGSALTVSFAWLLDSRGDDQYYARLSDTTHSIGGGNLSRVRNGGSLGLLIDLGAGADYYVEPRIVHGVPLLKGNKGILFDDGP